MEEIAYIGVHGFFFFVGGGGMIVDVSLSSQSQTIGKC